jgi:hypothetical protein
MKTLKVVTSLTIALLAGFWLWLRFLMWEPSGVEQGTLAYWLKVPETIRSMRLWQAQSNPRYDVQAGDGAVPGYVRVRYQAGGSMASFQDAVVRDGFACADKDRIELQCERRQGDGYDQVYASYDWQSDIITVRAEFTTL